MGRLLLGAVIAAVTMFALGWLFHASGMQNLAFRSLDNGPAAAVQQALAANIGAGTGTYSVPGTGTAEQTAMYGKGPIATIHYNFHGFAAVGGALIGVFVLDLLAALVIALGLSGLSGGRSVEAQRLVLALAVAAAGYIQLKKPLFLHLGWGHFLYEFVADAVTLAVGGLIVARWFLPRAELHHPEAPAAPAEES
jgi:hypothetical protein